MRDEIKRFEKEFEKNIKQINISKNNEHDDLRLMKVFIAKIKWNIAVKDMNRKTLIEMTAIPSIKDKLHKIILYEKRYIQQCYKKIINGNIIIRRLLIFVEYIHRYLLVWQIEMKREVSYLIFYKRNQAGMNMKLCWDDWFVFIWEIWRWKQSWIQTQNWIQTLKILSNHNNQRNIHWQIFKRRNWSISMRFWSQKIKR